MKRILTAATVAVATLTALPVLAGQTLTFGYTAKTQEEAEAMRAGLAIYSLVNDIHTNGHVTQNGVNNAAGIVQGGGRNRAIIHQDGNNHNGSIYQTGGNNSCGLFQFGNGATGHVRQSGGQTCIVIQHGF